jgi:hypothetical protein
MLFPMLNVLYFYISTVLSIHAVRNMIVFCSSLISYFPGMLLRNFLKVWDDSSCPPVVYWYQVLKRWKCISVFTFHLHCISIATYLYCTVFWTSFFVTFLSPETATSNNTCHFALPRIIISGLLLGIVRQLSGLFQNVATLLSWLVSTNSGTCLYRRSLSNFTRFLAYVKEHLSTDTIISY